MLSFIVNFISVHSVYMNLLYIRILTTNKVKGAVKHISVTYFFAFLWRCHLNLQLHIWMGDIWFFCHTCHIHVWTSMEGRYLIVLLHMSYAHVNFNWGVYLMALPQMSYAHVNCSCGGYIGRISSKNLNSFWVWLLLHRGLFYERPISEIQVSDSEEGIDTDDNDNDSVGWRSLPDMVTTLEDSDSSDTDGAEWLDDSAYEQNHTISNSEYTKLKLSNFVVKILNTEPITALFDTGATCSCLSQQVFMKISNKVKMMKKPLKLNTAWRYFRTNWDSFIRNWTQITKILWMISLCTWNWNNI